jgi:hypothetical protein
MSIRKQFIYCKYLHIIFTYTLLSVSRELVLNLGQFVIIRHVIKYFFYSLECASCKVRNLSNCSKICQNLPGEKSGKYIYASRSYRGLEFRPHRSSFADFLHEIIGVPVDSRYCVIICSIYSGLWIE